MSICGPGDDQTDLTVEGLKSVKSNGDNVLMPASIRKHYKQLYFRLIKGERLPKTDRFGTIDAYIVVDHNNSRLRSQTIT